MQKLHTEISLEGLEFFAHHGYYPEEQSNGNTFSVDVKVIFEAKSPMSDNLEKTVNYERLFAIVEKEIAKTSKLLETVAAGILDEIFLQFEEIQEAEVAVSKLNPPVKGKCARARVLIRKLR
jgi:7,8-dihydroneopterin aldolase/epimerase/oxygenase